MAEHMRASQSKSTKFYGTLVVCPTPGVRIVKIDEPSLGERYFTLRRSDFPQEAVLSICGGTMPVLSEEKIVYEGQPVLALFGPDSESVVLMARQFALETAPLEKEEALDLDEGAVNEITIGTPPASLEGLREVTGSIHFKGITQPSPARVECECWQEGEKLHVELPTQWPALVATNLARILSVAPADVVVHQMPCSPDADEYLIQPTLMAIVCAMAALTDIGFAGAVAEKLAQADPEKYTICAEKLSAKAEKAAQRRREQQIHEKKLRGRETKPYVPTRIKRSGKQEMK